MLRSVVIFLAAAAVAASSGTTADRDALARANNGFGLALFGRLAGTSGNVLFSPYSITSALTLLDAGARGSTESELGTALQLPFSGPKLTPAAGQLRNTLVTSSDYQLSSANALWPGARVKVRPEYIAMAKRDFVARVEPLDFTRSKAAAATINGWVSDATHGRIPMLVTPSMLTPATRLVLTNAVWFKGQWGNPFKDSYTHPEAFHLAGGTTVQVPLMHQYQAWLPFAKFPRFRLLEMTYGGGMSMIVLLPDDVAGLRTLEASLTQKDLDGWIAQLKNTNVDVTFPSFHDESSYELSEPLKKMGMARAFERTADFSGITASEPIAIDLVIHKARIDVTEKGTEAAAATGLVVETTAAAPLQVKSETFRADHPFLYLIRHKETGTILFLGRLADPR